MKRRDFIGKTMIAGGMVTPVVVISELDLSSKKSGINPDNGNEEEIVIKRPAAGRPNKGKVLAAIQPHCDGIAYFAAGTVAKLIHEGYTAYLIRTTNDDAAGSGNSTGR